MKNPASDLLLLMTHLSQLREPDQIIRLFIESMNDIFPEYGFVWAETDAPGENGRTGVCTRKNSFGFIRYSGRTAPDEMTGALIQNSGQMLGIILEKLKQEQVIVEQNNHLKRVAGAHARLAEQLELRVAERTADLELANKTLAESREAALDMMENAMDARRRAEETAAALMREITDRKRAENALREREAFIRGINDNLASGMIYQVVRFPDGSRKFTYLSDAVRRFYGVTPQEGKENADLIYGRIHEEDRLRVWEEEEAAHRTLSPLKTEVRMIAPSGDIRWSSFTSTPRGMEDGSTCWDGVEVDITDRKRAEDEKVQLVDQLVQAQKMESVGRLAGGVAHDFNNMLAIIIGRTELAMLNDGLPEPARDNLREIEKAARRSADLTRQLLAFARKQTVAPKVLDLNQTVEEMLKMLRRLIGEDIGLVWSPSPGLWPVRVDPAQIDQILANLAVNARDAIAGVGKVVIETGNAVFDEACCSAHAGFETGEYVMLAVSDTGCGMDRETQAKIFEPFFTTKELGKGTGLGLATVYGIVRQNNGFITVTSEPGKGAIFRIYLPRYANPSDPASPETSTETSAGGPETVLVVEDEPAILEMARIMLERLGYTVLTAAAPGEAIRLAEKNAGRIHLLMTDVVMPEMNGRDLGDRLLSLCPDLKRLFMSGYTADVLAPHGVLDKNVYFIQKPFSMKELSAKVRAALSDG